MKHVLHSRDRAARAIVQPFAALSRLALDGRSALVRGVASNIEKSFGTISAAKLAAKSKALGVRLPADYARFIQQHNGATFKRETFSFVEGSWETESAVQALYSWSPHPHFEVERVRRNTLPLGFPPGVLFIGTDPGGNQIALALDGARRGQVWFWDQDVDPREDPWRAMCFVAKSFSDFLALLY
jgi:hypothetical protein